MTMRFSRRLYIFLLILLSMLVFVACASPAPAPAQPPTQTPAVDPPAGGEPAPVDLTGAPPQPDNFPRGSLTGICPWAAGGATDISFRAFMSSLSNVIGTDINVLNVTGGSGSIGITQALAAPPNGYTIAMLNYDTLSNEISGVTQDSFRDFQILNIFTVQSTNFFVSADSGWETFEEFRQAALDALAADTHLQIGVAGLWYHAAILMAREAGISEAITIIPFTGSAYLITELLGGHLDGIATTMAIALPHLDAGTMLNLGTMREERMEDFPHIPTFIEMGYDVVQSSFRAAAVHRDTPQEIVDWLRWAAEVAWHSPDFLDWAIDAQADPYFMNYADATTYLENLQPVIRGIMEDLGLAAN